MKRIVLLFTVLFLAACKSDDDKNAAVIDAGLTFHIADNEGADLLDPANENSYTFDDIKVYDLIDGKRILVYNSYSDAPKGIKLISPEGMYTKYSMAMGFNLTGNNTFATRIIQWNKEEEDTFKVELKRKQNSIAGVRYWLNDSLIVSLPDHIGYPKEGSFLTIKK